MNTRNWDTDERRNGMFKNNNLNNLCISAQICVLFVFMFALFAFTERAEAYTKYPTVANISLEDLSQNKCRSTRDFIITNLSEGKVENTDIIPLRGGIGNKVKIDVPILNLKIPQIPIEPVGVIVIAIDGLRQDVLYKGDEQQVITGLSSGQNSQYYVQPSELNGLCEVMGGRYDGTTCDTVGMQDKHIKLQNVAAVFPSITLASWASIFTGKLPNETGILGNEFFARDLITYDTAEQKYKWETLIPAMGRNPAGMVTLSDGAFKKGIFELQALTPLSGNWEDSPQNNLLQIPTLYEGLEENSKFMSYFAEREGTPSVVVFQHYSRGADEWLTVDFDNLVEFGLAYIFKIFSEAGLLDKVPGSNAKKWLDNNLLNEVFGYKYRNEIPFPGIFTLYFAGLDHEAHFGGMSGYTEFFKNVTDNEIRNIVSWLNRYDEIDNKIFIITADHGHTAMPTDLPLMPDGEGNLYEADTSCELNLKDFDKDEKKYPELANNNLHIWELGEVLKLMPTGEVTLDGQKIYYKVLAPTEIVKANKGETTTNNPEQADITAAFNGPMAHIYVKGENGWDNSPQNNLLIKVADLLQASLAAGDGPIPRLASSIDAILVRLSRDSEYVVYNGATYTGEQIILDNPIPINTYFSDNSKYVDALTRIEGMNHPDRSGDIVLLMKDNTSGTALERYSTGSACKSWHGSLNPSDSYVPLIIAYPGGNKHELDVMTKKVCIDNLCEGNWKAKDLITEIIKTQYSGQ